MDITIYDYKNAATIVTLPEGVDKLHVVITTGDEIITYIDPTINKKITVDSSDCRTKAYVDYDYEVTDIKKWADEGKKLAAEIPHRDSFYTVSYERAKKYGYDISMFDVNTAFDAFFGSLSSIFSIDDDEDYEDDDDD